MTRETKVGLLVGMGLILLVGIILSDLLTTHRHDPVMTDYGPNVQNTLDSRGSGSDPTLIRNDSAITPPPGLNDQVHTPAELVIGRVPNDGGAPPTLNQTSVLNHPAVADAAPAPYFVQPGDDFAQIANKRYGDPTLAYLIRDANPNAITADGKLRVAARLTIPAKPTNIAMIADQTRTAPQPSIDPQPTPAPTAGKTIKVGAGDTLSSLATKYLGAAKRFPEIYQANKDVLPSVKATLHVGMVLKLPASAAPPAGGTTVITRTDAPPATGRSIFDHPDSGPSTPVTAGSIYVVKSGDTLYSIARSKLGNGEKWEQIYNANRSTIKDRDDLAVGTKLTLPQH